MADVEVPKNLVMALTVAVVVLAGVVVFLFRLYVARNQRAEDGHAGKDKMIADERQSWAVKQQAWETERLKIHADAELERAQLLADNERRQKEIAESYAAELAEMNDRYLAREDAIRKDFGDRIERIASEAAKSAHLQNEVLNKIYERFLGGSRRGRTGG